MSKPFGKLNLSPQAELDGVVGNFPSLPAFIHWSPGVPIKNDKDQRALSIKLFQMTPISWVFHGKHISRCEYGKIRSQ